MPPKPPTHPQDLREAFTSIITMMLGLLRAQGWRGLIHFPQIVLVVFLLRAIAKRFTALMDAHAAGTPRVRARPAAPRPRQPTPAKPARPQAAGATVRAPARAVPRVSTLKP